MIERYERLKKLGPYRPEDDDDMIVCRCEEITKGEIRRAVHEGLFTITEIRRFLRAGMGLCQGQTCSRLVNGIISRELQESPGNLIWTTARIPVRPVEMNIYGRESK